MEVVRRSPTIVLDAAHNPHGARAAAATTIEAFDFSPLVGVLDGDGGQGRPAGILRVWSELMPQHVVVTQVASTSRGMPAADLGELAAGVFGADRVTVAPRLDDALETAVSLAETDGPVLPGVLVTGSVVLVGEARSLLVRQLTAEEQTADEQAAVDPDDDWTAEAADDAAVVDPNLTGETVEGETLSVATAEFEDLEEPFADDVADDPFAEEGDGDEDRYAESGTPSCLPTSTRAVETTGELRPAQQQPHAGRAAGRAHLRGHRVRPRGAGDDPGVRGGPGLAAAGGGLATVVLALAAAGLLRKSSGYLLGWITQATGILLGLLTPAMFVVGAMFAGLWVLTLVLGQQIRRPGLPLGPADPGRPRRGGFPVE